MFMSNEKITLLSKDNFLNMVNNDPDLNIDNFKKININKLRDHFKITHIVNGKFKDMRGNCFKCLTPLKPDYTQFKNYCLDC